MSNLPTGLKYTQTHEWVQQNEDGRLTIGITDHAQELLGDLVFVELPQEGQTYAAEEGCVVMESVKAASDVYAPVSGEITDINPALENAPELVNTDPYGEGWLFKIKPDGEVDMDQFLDADAYQAQADSE